MDISNNQWISQINQKVKKLTIINKTIPKNQLCFKLENIIFGAHIYLASVLQLTFS